LVFNKSVALFIQLKATTTHPIAYFQEEKRKKKANKIEFGECFTILYLPALQALKNGVWLYISREFLTDVKAGLTP